MLSLGALGSFSSRPQSRAKYGGPPTAAKGRAASQKVHAPSVPFWLRFPSLSPYKEKGKLPQETKDRLERLARPRWIVPQPGEERADDGPSCIECTFAPKISAMWDADWQAELCKHTEAGLVDIMRMADSGAKRSNVTKEQLLLFIPNCGHAFDADTVCKVCRRRFCPSCWMQPCRKKISDFLGMAKEQKLFAIADQTGAAPWQAKAMLRAATPASKRLYSVKESPKALKKASTYINESSLLNVGLKSDSRPREQEISAGLLKLATPRVIPEPNQIPYLPGLKKTCPTAQEILGDEFDESTAEFLLGEMQKEGKIEAWQANVSMRNMSSVFDRLTTCAKDKRPPNKVRRK